MKELNVISNLIVALRGIPGIGNKSAERIAYELIKMSDSKLHNIIESLSDIQKMKPALYVMILLEIKKLF